MPLAVDSRLSSLILAMAAFTAAGASQAAAANDGWRWDLRFRYEQVDDKAFEQDAQAHTLRARLGYLWQPAPAWQLFVEVEHVEAFDDGYNSTANGRTGLPTIADPQSTELNQAWIAYGLGAVRAAFGRQRVLLDNQRFVGNVGWRQNEQTFDALEVEWRPGDAFAARYVYVDRVHRVFSDEAINPLLGERDHDSHLFNLGWAVAAGQRLTGYAYLLEDRDLAVDSAATFGLRWTGSRALGTASLGWTLEAARQREYGSQPGDFSLGYTLIEPRLTWGALTWTLGREWLEGDGVRGFATPLATLHAFNGWADRFLATPAAGLEDRYLGVGGKFGRASWQVAWHDYAADRGGAALGEEWNVSLGLPVPGRVPLQLLLKFADYRADGFGADVRKLWLQLEWKRP